jgi:alpha-beta hydrolase superfamily lysophospholipase
VGRYLAKRGYEFAGLDQRGFGDSEGHQGRVESVEINAQDNYEYHQKYVQHFGRQNTPIYIMSGSFGGQLALYSHLAKPDFYSGICIGAPYFRHKDEEEQRKLMPVVYLLARCFNRHYRMNFGYDTKQKPHVEHWDKDPKHLGMSMSMHTIIEFVRSLDHINQNDLFSKVKCPLLI